MPRKGYRLDRDGNQVSPWAPSHSTNIAEPTPRRGGAYDGHAEGCMAPPKVLNPALWFFENKHDRISKPMPIRTALDIMGIDYKE